MQQHYDYIISGSGCAGLSLLHRMLMYPFFSNKKILLIDKAQKHVNDRTWCYWEMRPGWFEEIVHHRWKQIDIYSNEFSARYDLLPYEYKMIRGIDLYNYVLNKAVQNKNITIVYEEVQSIHSNETTATVTTNNNEYLADYVFNSILLNNWQQQALQQKKIFVLSQHFKGWLIETKKDIFNDQVATFMDFRVDQIKGTAFVYALPVSKKQALVEYTLFSENILEQEEYDAALEAYIHKYLAIKKFTVQHSEWGIIPMTNYNFPKGENRIINIGTAGGQTKGSSGYTFQFIQKHAEKIVDALIHEKDPLNVQTIFEKRFRTYDGILLNVLKNKKMSGDKLFTQLFQKNAPQSVLKFLDNETNIKEELKIMNSVSLTAFLPAALKQIL